MKKLLLIGIIALLVDLPTRADLKVAMIDTDKAFDAFYKTKDMAIRIAAKKATFEKQIHDVQVDYQTSSQEAQNLENAVKSPSTPPDVRKSKDTALAEKVKDLQSLEQEINEMRRSRSQEIHDELFRSHQQIADEMMKIIIAYVGPQGYDLVLDKSTSDTSQSLFPYSSTKVIDLTAEIIVRLNASSPSH